MKTIVIAVPSVVLGVFALFFLVVLLMHTIDHFDHWLRKSWPLDTTINTTNTLWYYQTNTYLELKNAN